VMPAPTGPRTLISVLSEQLYYGSRSSDSPSVLFHLHDREHKQVMLVPAAPTRPRTLLLKQLYYGSSKSDVSSVTFPCVQQQQQVCMIVKTSNKQ
jgi:hypothetical protein